jgi:hypothetical protein
MGRMGPNISSLITFISSVTLSTIVGNILRACVMPPGLPAANPRAAADELERAVTKLGFKGAMVNGMTGGVFHDEKRFWSIREPSVALSPKAKVGGTSWGKVADEWT